MGSSADRPLVRTEAWELGDRIVQRSGVFPGEEVLEIACGTGIAAFHAAAIGASAVVLDVMHGLFDGLRYDPSHARLPVRWVAGQADSLPFADEAFDVVLSAFGLTFAGAHGAIADEVVRVLRPGGRVAMFNWSRPGVTGQLLEVASSYLPAGCESALLWGEAQHVEGLFTDSGLELFCEREVVRRPLRWATMLAERLDDQMGILVPAVIVRRAAERQGRWPQLRVEFERLHAAEDHAGDGEYLVVLGRKRLWG